MLTPAAWLPDRDYHPDLTMPRLVAFASLLRTVWLRCSELHEPTAGDDMWSMSCRAFTRCAYQLKTKSQQEWTWLTVTEAKKMQLVVTIGMIPARFYHGDSDEEVPLRYASPPQSETSTRQGLLDFNYGMKGLLRFVTKTDKNGLPVSVTLIEYDVNTDEIIHRFPIPEEAAAPAIPVIDFPSTQPKPGVTQPRPFPRPRTGIVTAQGDDDK